MSADAILDLAWMSGTWRGEVWGGEMEEHWTLPGGNTLVGYNRVVKGGMTVHREFLSIEIAGGGAVMNVLLARKLDHPIEPIAYPLIDLTGHRVVFANPGHERLSQIAYEREGERLRIRLEGVRNGEPSIEEMDLNLCIE